jgi:hypothetical protein
MRTQVVGQWLVFAAVFAVSVHASSKPAVASGALDGHIIVDGDERDWTGSLQPFGDAPFSIEAVNDGQYLYVRLSASSPDVRRQVTRFGLTVWFDPKGGSKKTFGVRYPVVEEPFDRYQGRGGGGFRGGQRERPQTPPEGGEQSDTQSDARDRVDILGPGKNDARSLTRDHLEGVAVAMKVTDGSLLYELQVPLATGDGRPYAIGTSAGKTIGIGFETPKVNRPSMSRGGGGFGGGGFGRGGFGGGRRGPGGGGGGRGGGGQRSFEPPKPLKAWGTLTLHE